MKRRRLLGAFAGTASLLSGCIGSVTAPEVEEPQGYQRILERDDFVDRTGEPLRRPEELPLVSLKAASSPPEQPSMEIQDGGTGTSSPEPTHTETSKPIDGNGDIEPPRTTGSSVDAGLLRVTDEYWQHRTHVSSYSIDRVTVDVHPNQPTVNAEMAKVYVAALRYPRQRIVAETMTERFTRSEPPKSISVDIDLTAAPRNERLHFVAILVPGEMDVDGVTDERAQFVMETDPFVIYAGEDRIRRVPREADVDERSGPNYGRTPIEGAFLQTQSWRAEGRDYHVNFLAFRSAYELAWQASRGRPREEYVAVELMNGTAGELASLLWDTAEANGLSSMYEKVEFCVDFVQSIPYVTDDVSVGFDDYTKFILETLVDLEGDCEDTSIMLAAILEAEPFNRDAVLIQPPGHMAVGIWGPELGGYQYVNDEMRYSYVETTGSGWGIGDIPDDYRGEDAEIHQV
jgi:hypothetical protein